MRVNCRKFALRRVLRVTLLARLGSALPRPITPTAKPEAMRNPPNKALMLVVERATRRLQRTNLRTSWETLTMVWRSEQRDLCRPVTARLRIPTRQRASLQWPARCITGIMARELDPDAGSAYFHSPLVASRRICRRSIASSGVVYGIRLCRDYRRLFGSNPRSHHVRLHFSDAAAIRHADLRGRIVDRV